MNPKQKAEFFVQYFTRTLPEPSTELTYQTPFQLLVAVVLSAQCTDKRVNTITKKLFTRFPDVYKMSSATIEEIYEEIKSCSYPNSKARYISEIARMVVSKFNGVVPQTVDELQLLPGVGRKTANVVVSVLYQQPAMPVDTHVFRVAARIGLTNGAKNPLQAEKQLVQIFDGNILHKAHHWLILHGRYVCKARKPNCSQCGLTTICDYFQNLAEN